MRRALSDAIADARAVRIPDRDRLADLGQIDAVVVVGATCAGKSTLVDAIRASEPCARGAVDVPLRYVTRMPRGGDNLVENVHVTAEEFAARIAAGEIDLHWIRRMEGGREVRYGFAPPRPGALPVLSANNAILAPDAGLLPVGRLDHALWVGVSAPPELRAQRLRRRSPDLWARPDEVAHRLAEPALDARVHLVIDNHGELEAAAKAEIVALVRALVL